MLVYANTFFLNPEGGTDQIIQTVAAWVKKRVGQHIDAKRLACGKVNLKSGNFSLSSRATWMDEGEKSYPFLCCVRFAHPDQNTSGRRWVTEVGLRQEGEGQSVACSVRLVTEESSSRVTERIQATRPAVVASLIKDCMPSGETPGLKIKELTLENAKAFLAEIERADRDHPMVVVSADTQGNYPVDIEFLLSWMAGLADVVRIPTDEDTFAIQRVVGRRFVTFGGAIRTVFPGRQEERGYFYENLLLNPVEIRSLADNGGYAAIASEVLSRITHRTNVPCSWRHVSQEKVEQAILRARLVREGDQSEKTKILEELLGAADQELKNMEQECERKEQESWRLQSDIEYWKHRFEEISDEKGNGTEASTPLLRDAVSAAFAGKANLQQVVTAIAALYSERIIFLESAKKSADKRGFLDTGKAFELLEKLATDYWQHLVDGRSDQHAKSVFGGNYSAKEAQLSNDGKRARTFAYKGENFLMEKHLKHGGKRSSAETLRIHFEWLSDEQKIIVGHCGEHLPL